MNELITIQNLNKKGIIELAEKKANYIIEGDLVCPLESLVLINKIELFAKTLKSKVSKGALIEAQKYNKEELKVFKGQSLQIAESGVKYDYSDDSEWMDLKSESNSINELLKDRETFLKTVKPNSVVNPVTSEYINPPLRTSSTTVKVTLK